MLIKVLLLALWCTVYNFQGIAHHVATLLLVALNNDLLGQQNKNSEYSIQSIERRNIVELQNLYSAIHLWLKY
jgi:hypothetical protein